jgi:elongation factor Ts
MSIQAKDVQQLRQRTGAGMMDCHRALLKVNGDIEAAVDFLRKQGVIKAAKRSGKNAKEGLIDIVLADDRRAGVMVELNCETDFVAKGDGFKNFTHDLSHLALKHRVKDSQQLLEVTFKGQETVQSAVQALAAKVGENVQLRRVASCISDDGIVGCYLHHQRVGALVALSQPDEALAQDIAMHIVAMNPIAISADDCPAEFLAREKKIFTEQAKNSGKPDHIIAKMIQGRLDKLLKEQTLLSQPFIKNDEQTIASLLDAHKARVLNFVRFEVGEGAE